MTKNIDGLHAAIMNLPCKPYDGTDAYTHYCAGHRDARHAAAELASAVAAEAAPAAQGGEPANEVSTARGCRPEEAGSNAGATPNASVSPAAGNTDGDLWRVLVARAEQAVKRDFGESDFDLIQRAMQPQRASSSVPEATLRHDAGAYAQCSYCQRYSLDPRTLSDRPPACECGQLHGWSGSFKPPGSDARWSGASPTDDHVAAPGGLAAPEIEDAVTFNPERSLPPLPMGLRDKNGKLWYDRLAMHQYVIADRDAAMQDRAALTPDNWDSNPDGIKPGQDSPVRMNHGTGLWDAPEALTPERPDESASIAAHEHPSSRRFFSANESAPAESVPAQEPAVRIGEHNGGAYDMRHHAAEVQASASSAKALLNLARPDLLRAAAYLGATNDSPDDEGSIDGAEADRIAAVLRKLAGQP